METRKIEENVEAKRQSLLQRMSGALAASFLFGRARALYEENRLHWNMPLNKWQKLYVGTYMILRDYAQGVFPPVFEDQQKAYQAEMDKLKNLEGTTLEIQQTAVLTKPFWGSRTFLKYARGFSRLWGVIEGLGVRPASRFLELGCGAGWMAEFFGMAGYHVVGTSIAPDEVAMAQKRVAALEAKGCGGRVSYAVGPMESVREIVDGEFDVVYVFEALHHAFDWRQAIESAYHCLKPDGWLVLASEPNVLHTYISYRTARLSNTHEIGFSKRELIEGLKAHGFKDVRALAPRWNNLVSQHWIVARK